jgi:hypothetical protein
MNLQNFLIEMERIEDISNELNTEFQNSNILKVDVLAYLIQKIINKLINGYFIQFDKILNDKKNIKVIRYYSRVFKKGFSCCPDVKFSNLERKIKKLKSELNKLLVDGIIIKDIVLSNLDEENGTFEMNISLEYK